jgi:hypothetical protein
MVAFLKLSFGVINTACINKILWKNNKYYLHVMSNTINVAIFSNGDFRSQDVYELCSHKNKTDYMAVTHWIQTL